MTTVGPPGPGSPGLGSRPSIFMARWCHEYGGSGKGAGSHLFVQPYSQHGLAMNMPTMSGGAMGTHARTHLQRLEAESVQIFREAVAESERPVMLYSVGKDSSVLLHLAQKAFFPSRPPFPLL